MLFVQMMQWGVIGCWAKSVFIYIGLIRRVGIREYASSMTISGRKTELCWVRGFVSLVRTIPIERCGSIANSIGHVGDGHLTSSPQRSALNHTFGSSEDGRFPLRNQNPPKRVCKRQILTRRDSPHDVKGTSYWIPGHPIST